MITRRDVVNELIDLLDSIFRASELEQPAQPRDLEVIRAAVGRTCARLHTTIEERN